MLPSPEQQNENVSEEDAYVWLADRARNGESGIRQTDTIWPEEFWLLADKVAGQGEVRPEDADRLSALYETWQNELNEEDAASPEVES